MKHLSFVFLMVLFLTLKNSVVHAAETPVEGNVLARWGQGFGSIGEKAAGGQAAIAAREAIRSEKRQPVRLYLAKSPGSSVIMAADSEIRFSEERGEAAGKPYVDLVISLERGAVQIDLQDRGPYRRLLLRGVATEVEILGTLLTGERVSQQEDFIVLVRGLIKVRLRREVAEALEVEDNSGVELGPRQGVGGSTNGGLGPIQALAARPQLASASSSRRSTKAQATEPTMPPASQEASWSTDEAGAMLDTMMDEMANTGNEGSGGGQSGTGAAAGVAVGTQAASTGPTTGTQAVGKAAQAPPVAETAGLNPGQTKSASVTDTSGQQTVDPQSTGSGPGPVDPQATPAKEVVQAPEQVGTPALVEGAPPADVETPAVLEETPAALMEKPEVVEDSPSEIIETPAVVEATSDVLIEDIVDELAEAVTDEVVEDVIDDAVILDEVVESVTDVVSEVQQELGGFPEPP